ncbi:DUF4349 domain-containing protein [Altererythrobacter arenosus]|uniref:DUF4349 domain-containing protein n=1 Tax=Altererythrobacter arenosus TaxID=3032592 RepID=A0ABY8FSD1_9SPHN|nr:DUF4349 domain-containing protein [Altererythrobacter sp. CAU 1644]WFL77910.1 DUF4349 domain-containing protein [Altererythrobacter sp. CAU 1644]
MRAPLTILCITIAFALASCDQADRQESVERVTTVDAEEASTTDYGFNESVSYDLAPAPVAPPPPPAPAMADSPRPVAESQAAPSSEIPSFETPVGEPQVAYRYALGFRLPATAIKPLQERHADLCEALGRSKCRIISMRQAEQDGDYSYGNLQLAVIASEARRFSKELENASGKVDGELISSSIDGEDLSKAIVDTEARLRARTLLRDRLMEVLRTRKGTVPELVQAERGVAQVNEEIDQAQSWLREMRNRVAFSQMQITYESGTPTSGGFIDPIRDAWGSIGKILGTMIAFIILAATILVPLGLVVWGAARLWRRNGGMDFGGWKPEEKSEEKPAE